MLLHPHTHVPGCGSRIWSVGASVERVQAVPVPDDIMGLAGCPDKQRQEPLVPRRTQRPPLPFWGYWSSLDQDKILAYQRNILRVF